MSRSIRNLALLIAAVAMAVAASYGQAQEWGSLKGRFIYDGKAPAKVPLKITKCQAVCGNKGLVAEDLVVGPKGGLANVMIWVRGKVKVNPEYAKTADATVVINNKNCRFQPHVQGIRVGQTLEIKNSDPVAHNTNLVGRNLQINPLIAARTSADQKIDAPESLPAMVSCNIHPWMNGRLLVRPNPYFAISKKDGTFEIKDLPAGADTFQVYQERSGYVQEAEVKGQKVTWKKGVMKVTIEPGKVTDLGDIKLPAEEFNK